jgi:hypothetical protein
MMEKEFTNPAIHSEGAVIRRRRMFTNLEMRLIVPWKV